MSITVDLSSVDRSNRAAVLSQCWLALMNAGGLDGDWIEISGELNTRDVNEVLCEYFTFDGDPPVKSRPIRYEVRDWTSKVLFDGKTFASFEDGWSHVYENVEDEDGDGETYDDYYVVPVKGAT